MGRKCWRRQIASDLRLPLSVHYPDPLFLFFLGGGYPCSFPFVIFLAFWWRFSFPRDFGGSVQRKILAPPPKKNKQGKGDQCNCKERSRRCLRAGKSLAGATAAGWQRKPSARDSWAPGSQELSGAESASLTQTYHVTGNCPKGPKLERDQSLWAR